MGIEAGGSERAGPFTPSEPLAFDLPQPVRILLDHLRLPGRVSDHSITRDDEMGVLSAERASPEVLFGLARTPAPIPNAGKAKRMCTSLSKIDNDDKILKYFMYL
jgi:hypothetical protein